MSKKKVAIIGIGNWGKQILKTAYDICDISIIGYKGSDTTKKYLDDNFPTIHSTTDIESIAKNTTIEAVFIATPIDLHAKQVELFLTSGKHVFIEKPLSTSLPEIKKLYKLAEEKNKTLFTGYVYLHDTALKQLIPHMQNTENTLELTWEKWGTFNSPITTNLLVHEIAIASYLLGSFQSVTTKYLDRDKVSIKIQFKRGAANITINRRATTRKKCLKLITHDALYTLEGGVLKQYFTHEEKIIFDVRTQQTLANECSAFLAATNNGSTGNKKRQQIDTSVARILNELS